MRYIIGITQLFFVLLAIQVAGQPIPPGYYDSANGLTGEPLRTELSNIIDNHTVVSYSNVWSHFQTLDDEGGGEVWDIYSDNPAGADPYTFALGTDQCGNYSAEGDCYNREHSVPHSWFNSASPMYTDLFALYPTDGYVNGQRANLPYGETNSPSWTSMNGSQKGNSSIAGYSGTVFEPIDEYKGDIARTYFYMMTRYKFQVSGWTSDMFSGDNMTTWAVNMMIQWSDADPVSQKELDRNDAIYQIQGNRNPYIDHPEWVKAVWWSINGTPSTEKENMHITLEGGSLEIALARLDDDATYVVYDLTGREVIRSEFTGKVSEPLEIPKGIYIVRVISSGDIVSKKIRFFR